MAGPPEDPASPAREVKAWVEIVIYGLGPGESRIGWSGPGEATSHVPLLDAAIRVLTEIRRSKT